MDNDLIVEESKTGFGPDAIAFTFGDPDNTTLVFKAVDGKLDITYDKDKITEAAELFIDWLKERIPLT